MSAKTKHNVHSPFVYNLLTNAILSETLIKEQKKIEALRAQLKCNHTKINFTDYGAGSIQKQTNTRTISNIAASSAKSKKYAELLYRLTHYFEAKTVVELGTSLGISTAYLAAANPKVVYTLEGCKEVSDQAKINLDTIGIKNVQFIKGDFKETLPNLLSQIKSFDIAFIDGNHRLNPTLNYFNILLKKTTEHSCLIFDDINWNEEMKQAWKEIVSHPDVTISIDLFFLGLVFVNKNFTKQHFVLLF